MPNELQVWSPFREIDRMRHNFDELFNQFFGVPRAFPATSGNLMTPAIECLREKDRLLVRADLPGIDPKDVEVTVSGNILTLSGKREQQREEKSGDYLHREVSYGNFERTMSLPPGVKAEDIKASYERGVLELSIPLPKEASVHKIPIEAGKESAAVAGKS
ncbi:MAG: Hsp20/alpha crystallin family protein [Candidatus Binataceae bacterium]